MLNPASKDNVMLLSKPYNKELFDKYQKILLVFANTFVGKKYLGIKDKRKITKLFPNGYTVEIDEGLYQSTFTGRPKIARKLDKVFNLTKLGLGFTFAMQGAPAFALTTTAFEPDPNPETTTVDGASRRESIDENWATIRAGAGTAVADSDTSTTATHCYISASATTDQYDALYRGFYLFDTSSIPDTDDINSAIFKVYVTAHGQALGSSGISLCKPATASNTALATADHAIAGWDTTKQATDKAFALTNDAYNEWTLNATGLGNIAKTGITKLGLLMDLDQANTTPTWSSGADTYLNGHFADAANAPTLTVVHGVVSGGFYFMSS